jgi:hypothetical protein
MSDTFVPMRPVAVASANDFTPLPAKPAPSANGRTVPAAQAPVTPALAAPPAPARTCAPPKVTLQRQGDLVSSIRIQCPCGQVIELNCVY